MVEATAQHGTRVAGAKGGRHGDRIVGGRGGRVLCTLRLGHRDGGAPVEGATRSAAEALSENPSGRCETDALIQALCRVLPPSCDIHVAPAHPPPWGDSAHPDRADCSDCAQMVHAPRQVTGHRVATRALGEPGVRAARRAGGVAPRLLIDCEEDRTLRAVLVGMLRERSGGSSLRVEDRLHREAVLSRIPGSRWSSPVPSTSTSSPSRRAGTPR
jgi:hypothetical protein